MYELLSAHFTLTICMQAGSFGVLQGAVRFDHTRGYQFSTYVQYWIKKSMSMLVALHARGIRVPVCGFTPRDNFSFSISSLYMHIKKLNFSELCFFVAVHNN